MIAESIVASVTRRNNLFFGSISPCGNINLSKFPLKAYLEIFCQRPRSVKLASKFAVVIK